MLSGCSTGTLLELEITSDIYDQSSGLPLLGAAVLLLLNEITVAIPQGRVLQQAASPLAMGLLVVGFPMFLDAAGLAVAMEQKVLPGKATYHLNEAHLESMKFADCSEPGSPNDNGQNFVRYTEEGIALIQTNTRPGESVQGMGMSNPFSFATLRPPSHGGAVNLSKTNIALYAVPPKKLLFGDVALLMVPKFPASERDTLAAIERSYPELLGTEYLRVAESPNWVLYRRANGLVD